MRSWDAVVRERLSTARIDGAARERIYAELVDMLDACEAEARDAGAGADEARAAAAAQIPDWPALVRSIEEAETRRTRPLHRRGASLATAASRLSQSSEVLSDMKSSIRHLSKRPLFAVVVIATLALGVGANTAIFSLVETVLLRPLPYEQPDELVRVFSAHPEHSLAAMGVSSGDVVDWRARSDAFDGIAAWYAMGRTLRADDVVEVVNVAQVSEDFFPVFGVTPVLGRTFSAEETSRATFNTAAAHTGTDPVVVLSYTTWQQRFGGDPDVLARTLTLDRQTWRIIGVMPTGFDMPSRGVELWIPWSFEGKRPHDQRYLTAVARIADGFNREQAEANLNGVATALGEELPESNEGWRVQLVPLREDLVGSAGATLIVVFGAVGVVLLVACVNLASLYLVRIGERQKEIVLRYALGASKLRVAAQFLFENVLLAAIGGALSIPVALGLIHSLSAGLPDGFSRAETASLNLPVLLFALSLTAVAGILFGLVPLVVGAKLSVAESFRAGGSRGATGSAGWERLRKALVVAELALAVVLLTAGGLLVRSFEQLMTVDVGFRPERVVVLPITLDNHEYDSGAKSRAYYRNVLDSLGSVPGVVSTGAVTALPMSPIGPDFDRPVWADGEQPPPGGAGRADVRMATPGYFETLGIALARGRTFDETDSPEGTKVVIVNESLAKREWPDSNPVGQKLVIDYSTAGTHAYEVVGVVSDVRFYGIRSAPRPELYLPHAQRSYLIMNVAVRTEADPEAIVSQLRAAVLAVDPMQPAYDVLPLSELVHASVSRDRFAMLLVASFGATALVLALLGIFGVVSYDVTQRAHEVGIRAALGASRRDLVTMIVSMGMKLTGIALVLGVTGAILSVRLLSSMLFGISPIDPPTFLVVVLVPALGALLACYLPARRTAQVDPAVALRHD